MKTEEELILKAKEFDEQTLAKLCEKYYKVIYHYIYYRTSNIQDAEDLTHEVFVRMVNNINEQKGNFKSWLYTIAKNLLTDYYRKKQFRKTMEQLNKMEDMHTSTLPMEHEILDREVLRVAIKELSQEQQDVIVLKYISDLSNQDVAHIIKKSEGAVKVIANRAIQKLKHSMEIINV